MFSTSLLPLPPPSASLLPSLSQTPSEPLHQQLPPHLQSRRKPTHRLNTPLMLLSNDERLIASRKLAIAMYGYSWLKPAGCTKTMLGRREEELEREEVERQLREVELQERMAVEQEEMERREELRRQAEGGEVEGVEERDLDEDVPEAVEEEEDEDGGSDVEDGIGGDDTDEEDMDGDLDDEVPDADMDGQESSWIYDTRREPDTESEDGRSNNIDDDEAVIEIHTYPRQTRGIAHMKSPARRHHALDSDDPAATEALVNAMLDEDELGDYEHDSNSDPDLDDDIPDMDRDLDDSDDINMDMDIDMDANLSSAIPSSPGSNGWEHTDSELDESAVMDVSLLPPHPAASSRNPGTTHEEMRRVSGNRMLPPPPQAVSQTRPGIRGEQLRTQESRSQQHLFRARGEEGTHPRTAPRNIRAMMTPGTADDLSTSLLISTGEPSTANTNVHNNTNTNTGYVNDSIDHERSPNQNRRSWLNPAAARRNLFGGLRSAAAQAQGSAQAQVQGHAQTRTTAPLNLGRSLVAGVSGSSGGLFTPSPRVGGLQTPADDDGGSEVGGDGNAGVEEDEEEQGIQSRTRSGRGRGRLLGLASGLGVGRRARRDG